MAQDKAAKKESKIDRKKGKKRAATTTAGDKANKPKLVGRIIVAEVT